MSYGIIIKGKKFLPNPVAKFGIPDIADSSTNPKVEGTTAWEQWWAEQFDRCVNGYTTGGIFISGRFYYYLNFCRITTLERGRHHPDFVDLDLEYFNLVEQAKTEYKGIISVKARRKGLSEKGVAVLDYGLHFKPEQYRGGICAGDEKKVDDFYQKLINANYDKAPELRLQTLLIDDEFLAGWKEQTSSGWEKKGSLNQVIPRTMFASENAFRGQMLNDCFFEEAGDFKKLFEGYNATKKCFSVGSKMVGTSFVYGTGGNLKTSSKAFADMWNEADTYDLLKFEVMADRLQVGFFVGSINHKGEKEESCPHIFNKYRDYDYEQLLGCEDVVAATDDILMRRKKLREAKNKTQYFKSLQEEPLNVKEAFMKFSGNNFDTEILNENIMRLDQLEHAMYAPYILSLKKDKDGIILQPLQIEITPAPIEAPDDMVVLIHRNGMPQKQYKNMYLHGIDSYDQDESATSLSLGGGMIVARKGNPIDPNKRVPLAIYYERPNRKEKFWEIQLLMSIYWDTLKNTMIDVDKPGIIDYYKKMGCKRFLSPRPLSFESDASEQSHEFGVKWTIRSKPQGIAMLQSWVIDESEACVFPIVLKEFLDYDVEKKNSDWDIVDALMCALARDVDMKRSVSIEKEDEVDPFDVGTWVEDADGNVVNTSPEYLTPTIKLTEGQKNNKNQPDIFIQMLERGEI